MTFAQSPIMSTQAGIMIQSSHDIGLRLIRWATKRSIKNKVHSMIKTTEQAMTLSPLYALIPPARVDGSTGVGWWLDMSNKTNE